MTDLRSLESELEALEEEVRKKMDRIKLKKIQMMAMRLNHEEQLMKLTDKIGVIEEVSRNLRERGTQMTLNEIKLMSQQI